MDTTCRTRPHELSFKVSMEVSFHGCEFLSPAFVKLRSWNSHSLVCSTGDKRGPWNDQQPRKLKTEMMYTKGQGSLLTVHKVDERVGPFHPPWNRATKLPFFPNPSSARVVALIAPPTSRAAFYQFMLLNAVPLVYISHGNRHASAIHLSPITEPQDLSCHQSGWHSFTSECENSIDVENMHSRRIYNTNCDCKIRLNVETTPNLCNTAPRHECGRHTY